MLKCPYCLTQRNIRQNLDDHIRVMHPAETIPQEYEGSDASTTMVNEAASRILNDPFIGPISDFSSDSTVDPPADSGPADADYGGGQSGGAGASDSW